MMPMSLFMNKKILSKNINLLSWYKILGEIVSNAMHSKKEQCQSVFYCIICDDSICLNKSSNCMAETHFDLV